MRLAFFNSQTGGHHMAQIPAKTKDHPDVQAMYKQREEINKSNEEAMARMESTQPTPTQEENDLAKLGVAVEDKEPDGAGPTVIRTFTVANVPLGAELPDMPEVTPQDPAAREKAARERTERDQAKREQAERERAERERAQQAKL